MATSQNQNGSEERNSMETTFPSNQQLMHPGNIEAMMNALTLQQRGDQKHMTPDVFTITGSFIPGTLESETLNLKLSEAKRTFIPTNVFKDIRHSLEKNCHVTICGASGEGKTTMALMLGREYRKQGYELVFVDRPDKFDLGSCISSSQKICLIFDDIFGSVGRSTNLIDAQRLCDSLKLHIDKNFKKRLTLKTEKNTQGLLDRQNDDRKYLHEVKNSKSNEIRVIFTSKTYDFKEEISKIQYQRVSMFTKSVVDLTVTRGSSYSHEEKREMFQKHREMHPNRMLGDLQAEDIISQDSSHLFGFPLTCRLFFDHFARDKAEQEMKAEQKEKKKARAIDFFRRPLYYLRIELNNILARRNDQSAALILVMLCEGNLKLPELEAQNRNQKVDELLVHVAMYTHSATRSGIAYAAKSFRGTFFARGDNLCFAHSSIYEACACALYQFNPTLVLQYCSLDFLYERLKSGTVDESRVSDQLHYLFISEEYFPVVITRFVSSMKEGIFSKTVAHPIMQNKLFVRKFLEEISHLDIESKAWIKWKESEKGFLFWVVKSNGTYLVENIERFLQITFTNDDVKEALFASVQCDSFTLFKFLMDKLDGKLEGSFIDKYLLGSAESSGEKMVKYLLEIGADVSSIDTENQTIIHLLCAYNRPDILEVVLTHANKQDLKLALSTLDDKKRTPLMFAALKGTFKCFRLVKCVKPDVSLVDENRDTLLHISCSGGNKHIVESVPTPQNINSRGQYGRIPVMVAASEAKSDTFDLLLSQGADVPLVDEDGNTLLHLACSGGNKHIVESVLTPQNINSRGEYGSTPVMVAASGAKTDIFDLLLSQEADVSLVDCFGNTLLHHACSGGNKHIVESVLTPQNINSRGEYGSTPVMVAASEAKSDIFDLLLSQGADVSLVDCFGDTLLHLACSGGNKHIVKSVLTPQNINSRGQYGRTPVMVAAGEAKPGTFDLLLSLGADVSLVDEDVNTLLHVACSGGNNYIVESVLTPQNINSRGQYGKTPVMVAASEAKSDTFDLLLSQGADVSLVDEDGYTLLHLACSGGNKHIVESVLTPQNINSRGEYGRTPVMVAASEAKSDTFDLLLSQGAHVSLVDEDRNTLLHIACSGGNKHIVESVLTPQNINSRGQYGRTPVMVAASEAKPDIFDLLLCQGADVSLVDEDGDTLLHLTCSGGNKHIVESVLTPQNINSRGQYGRTPVMVAASEAKSDIFDLLLSQGADVSLVDEDGDTLLHLACSEGNKHIVESVLTPQNINSRGEYGRTPVMVAAGEAKTDIFDLLLSQGADVPLVDCFGNTLLHLACSGGNKHIVDSVLTLQNINSRGQYGRTPVMVAASKAKTDIFDLLLSQGADVSLVDCFGDTLLHRACSGGNKHIVESVLTSQNINSRGQNGRTPVMVAASKAKTDIFDLLLSQGAGVSLVDCFGNTLLHLACSGGNKHIVESVLTPQNINSRGQNGMTPVMVAASKAKTDIFELLLSQGADVSLVDCFGNTLLHLACSGGNKHIVESVLTPQDINSRGQNGMTPVMVAASKAKTDIFELLLSQGADVSLVDCFGNTLLHLACSGGNKHIVESVLTPQNINSRGEYGRTPVMFAAGEAKTDIFDLLLSQGADVSLVDCFGNTLLHLACSGGNKQIVESVLTPQNINSRGEYGRTPVMVAAGEAKTDIFDLLLSQGADVSLVDEDGDTLLHLACSGGNKHIVESVLTPQNINSRGEYGRTPVMVAAGEAKTDIFDLLLSQGADVSLVDEDGDTLLHLACSGGNKHIVESVLTPQNINSRGEYGRTPVMVAASEAKSDIFDLLLSQGADVSLVDEDGDTLLHRACSGGNKHIVESVLTPQNINRRGEYGRTPVMVAVSEAKSEIFDLLLSQGADVSRVDCFGNTILHLACSGGNKHIVESLLTPQNINSRRQNGRTPVMVAASGGKSDIFDLLLCQGADVSLVDEDGDTLLHRACSGGNKHIVESVLTPQNINRRGEYGRTPVMVAVSEAKFEIFDLLLSQGTDVSRVDCFGNTILHRACSGGNKHIVESVLTPQNINSRGQNGRTPVMVAASGGKSDIFDLLLSQGADVSLVDEDGDTLLHRACSGGNKHIVESVLTPQNINSRGQNGRTPVMVAASEAKSDIFDLLLSQGADVSLVDCFGDTLLHLACSGGNKHIVKSVLTPQNINSRGQYGRTPVMVAAGEAKPGTFDLLLSLGADVSLVDEDVNTLLHVACSGGNKHIVESVLTPQNINSRGEYGRTPVMVAAIEAKSAIFDLLLSQGADVSLVDEDGDTLLHRAYTLLKEF